MTYQQFWDSLGPEQREVLLLAARLGLADAETQEAIRDATGVGLQNIDVIDERLGFVTNSVIWKALLAELDDDDWSMYDDPDRDFIGDQDPIGDDTPDRDDYNPGGF